MRKKDDYRTIGKKIYDFAYKHKTKIIIYSFVISLIIFIISIFTLNKGGFTIIFAYPLALLGFLWDLYDLKWFGRGMEGAIVFMLIAIISFILGFFIEF